MQYTNGPKKDGFEQQPGGRSPAESSDFRSVESLDHYPVGRDPFEFVSERELQAVLNDRYGIDQFAADELAAGNALVKNNTNKDLARGLFGDSAEAVDVAKTPQDANVAWSYFMRDASTALFEVVTEKGHLEQITNQIDESGDAIIAPGQLLCPTLLYDLMEPSYKWRAQLSFIEFKNMVLAAELGRRGVLQDNVLIEQSPYAYDAPADQARNVGYRIENCKGYLRAHTDNGNKRELYTLSYSGLLPSDVDILRTSYGMPEQNIQTTAQALGGMFLMPKDQFYDQGGLAGLAAKLDSSKSATVGQAVGYGEVGVVLSVDDYLRLAEVSAARKQHASRATQDYAEKIYAVHRARKEGLIGFDDAIKLMGDALLTARKEVLLADRELAREQFGDDVVQEIDRINEARSRGDYAEADRAEAKLQHTLGEALMCGLRVQLDPEGNPINPDGTTVDCPEITNGQVGRCPGCKKDVKIIVVDRSTLYCSNQQCHLSQSGGRVVETKQPKPKIEIFQNAGKISLAAIISSGAEA